VAREVPESIAARHTPSWHTGRGTPPTWLGLGLGLGQGLGFGLGQGLGFGFGLGLGFGFTLGSVTLLLTLTGRGPPPASIRSKAISQ
jgi:hypothetical protein